MHAHINDSVVTLRILKMSHALILLLWEHWDSTFPSISFIPLLPSTLCLPGHKAINPFCCTVRILLTLNI